jgi:hypothetical protein
MKLNKYILGTTVVGASLVASCNTTSGKNQLNDIRVRSSSSSVFLVYEDNGMVKIHDCPEYADFDAVDENDKPIKIREVCGAQLFEPMVQAEYLALLSTHLKLTEPADIRARVARHQDTLNKIDEALRKADGPEKQVLERNSVEIQAEIERLNSIINEETRKSTIVEFIKNNLSAASKERANASGGVGAVIAKPFELRVQLEAEKEAARKRRLEQLAKDYMASYAANKTLLGDRVAKYHQEVELSLRDPWRAMVVNENNDFSAQEAQANTVVDAASAKVKTDLDTFSNYEKTRLGGLELSDEARKAVQDDISKTVEQFLASDQNLANDRKAAFKIRYKMLGRAVTFSTAVDECGKVGEGWTIPSIQEVERFFRSSSVEFISSLSDAQTVAGFGVIHPFWTRDIAFPADGARPTYATSNNKDAIAQTWSDVSVPTFAAERVKISNGIRAIGETLAQGRGVKAGALCIESAAGATELTKNLTEQATMCKGTISSALEGKTELLVKIFSRTGKSESDAKDKLKVACASCQQIVCTPTFK